MSVLTLQCNSKCLWLLNTFLPLTNQQLQVVVVFLWVFSPPRHMAKLDGDPQDGGGVGADASLKGETQQNWCFRIKPTSASINSIYETSVREYSLQNSTGFKAINYLMNREGQKHSVHRSSSWIFQHIFHHKPRPAGHLLSGNPPRRRWFLYPLPWQVQLDRRETIIRRDVSSNSSNGWRGFVARTCGRTWGRDRGRGIHVRAAERRVFEADRPRFLWELLKIDTILVKAFCHNKSIYRTSKLNDPMNNICMGILPKIEMTVLFAKHWYLY